MALRDKNILERRFKMKGLDKAIVKRSRLRNKFLSDRTDLPWKEYIKQRKFCVNFLKKAKKKKHFGNLDVNCMTDNNKFWDIVKLFFSIKVKAKITIELVEITKLLMIKLKSQN